MILSSMLKNRLGRVMWLCFIAISLCACSDDGTIPPKAAGYSQTHNWQVIKLADVNESGLNVPYVVARQDANYQVHVAYYDVPQVPDGPAHYQLNYLLWNPSSGAISTSIVDVRPAYTGVDGFERCDQFDMALEGSTPVLIYPTYENDTRLQYIEADIMVNLYEAGSWNESTGVVGYVPRNPEYQDGHVKDNMSVVVDSQGDIHMAYQYYTEGMDSANYRYPDLYYARRDRATLTVPITTPQGYEAIEERVDGNAFSTYGDHNSVGFHCKLVLDPEELPVIVYSEHGENFDGTFALRVAYRDISGQWHRETVEALPDGWTVGGISAAFYPPPIPDPTVPVDPEAPEPERPLAIAYSLRSPSPEPDDAHHLKFAVKREGRWSTEIVDETTWCGTHCSLAFTPEGMPAIAYLDEESHSGRIHHYLKYAEFNGLLWSRQTAEEQGNVGKFNTLYFDARGLPAIMTFSDEDNEILLVRLIN